MQLIVNGRLVKYISAANTSIYQFCQIPVFSVFLSMLVIIITTTFSNRAMKKKTKQYLVLSILHTCFRPWSEDLNVFSSVNTTLDQKSRSLPTCCVANASRPSRCAFVRVSFFAGILWCIPAPWSRLRIVSIDTCSCSWCRCSTTVLNGCSWGIV